MNSIYKHYSEVKAELYDANGAALVNERLADNNYQIAYVHGFQKPGMVRGIVDISYRDGVDYRSARFIFDGDHANQMRFDVNGMDSVLFDIPAKIADFVEHLRQTEDIRYGLNHTTPVGKAIERGERDLEQHFSDML